MQSLATFSDRVAICEIIFAASRLPRRHPLSSSTGIIIISPPRRARCSLFRIIITITIPQRIKMKRMPWNLRGVSAFFESPRGARRVRALMVNNFAPGRRRKNASRGRKLTHFNQRNTSEDARKGRPVHVPQSRYRRCRRRRRCRWPSSAATINFSRGTCHRSRVDKR